MYCEATRSSNTVSVIPSVTVFEFLVQVTVVAGPPVETQVSVNSPLRSELMVKVGVFGIDRSPVYTVVHGDHNNIM